VRKVRVFPRLQFHFSKTRTYYSVESEGMDMDEAEAIVNPPSDDSVAMSESSRQSGQPRRKSVLDGPYWQSL
jgi:hypothetical protein